MEKRVHIQSVRWGPNDDLPAGIRIFADGHDDQFLPWDLLELELVTHLLPQCFADPSGWRFALGDYNGKVHWLLHIVNRSGERLCDVWLGEAPPDWIFDGCIRVGTAEEEPHVWQTYQRYSDGSYRRTHALVESLDSRHIK